MIVFAALLLLLVAGPTRGDSRAAAAPVPPCITCKPDNPQLDRIVNSMRHNLRSAKEHAARVAGSE